MSIVFIWDVHYSPLSSYCSLESRCPSSPQRKHRPTACTTLACILMPWLGCWLGAPWMVLATDSCCIFPIVLLSSEAKSSDLYLATTPQPYSEQSAILWYSIDLLREAVVELALRALFDAFSSASSWRLLPFSIAIGPLFHTQMLWQYVCKELCYFLYNIHELHKEQRSKEPHHSLYSLHIYVQQ